MPSNRNLNVEFFVNFLYNIYVFAYRINFITKDVTIDGKVFL